MHCSHIPIPNAHHAWVARLYNAFIEGRIHCPGCLLQERRGYECFVKILEKKSDRTPLEEEQLKFDRLKIKFLDAIYKQVWKKTAEKKAEQLALDRALKSLKNAVATPVATSSTVAAPAPAPASAATAAAVEEDLYA